MPFLNKQLTFVGLLANVTPRRVDFMDQIAIDEIETRIDRLIAAYNLQAAENRQLKEQLALMEERQATCRNRLDMLIDKLEKVDGL
jgi:hypothetical protein